MQRQHPDNRAMIAGDKETPAVVNLSLHARSQVRQEEFTHLRKPGRDPALHPDAGDLVIFLRAGGADHWGHRRCSCPAETAESWSLASIGAFLPCVPAQARKAA